MKKTFLFMVVFCLSITSAITGYGQPATADSSNNAATQKAVDLFYHSVNEDAHLYNGREHIQYDPKIKGTPYFLDAPEMQQGPIYYDGTLYQNVPLLYEITEDNVITRQYNNGLLMDLVSEKVDYFNTFGHTFINITEPDSINAGIASGFYDRLYNGNTLVLAKRRKTIYEDPNTFERSFQEHDRFYIYKNGTYHQVSDKGSVLSVFKDKRKDLSKYLRQNDISFKKDPEYAMVKMAEYYDKITH